MTRTGSPARRAVGLVVALAALAATAGCGAFGSDTKTLTARFDRAVGVYEASDVRILGVRIGQVTAIEPEGDAVRVEMEYDAQYDIPADAQALVVAPSIVSDRYVQLTPAYTGGPVLASGSTLDVDRTDVPLELDEIYKSLDDLNLALGPQGANRDGALSDLIAVSADNLEGNGELLGTTLEDFSQFVETLSDSRDDLFGTVNNLQQFTSTIAGSDATVRAFNRDLALVADQLAGEREDLARAVQQLGIALGDVAVFVRENRESLSTNVAELAEVTRVLVDQKVALEEFLDTAPGALSNLQLAYNPSSGTLDTRDNGISETENDLEGGTPLPVLCSLLRAQPSVPLPGEFTDVLGELARRCQDFAEGGGGQPGAPGGAPPFPSPFPGSQSAASAPATPAPTDLSLAGLLMGTR
ncbi:MAG TPA: MCE family protein [Mycobacteriales bacterium]|nr:MCE family protein [Mycobacteriales bacterium]